jgi:hypothetical protein
MHDASAAGSEGHGTEGVTVRHGGGRASGGRRRGAQDDSDVDRTDAESVASSSQGLLLGTGTGSASGLLAGVKPPPRGVQPISAAQLSLGKRLKKQLEESGRPGASRRNSGGLAMWKTAES